MSLRNGSKLAEHSCHRLSSPEHDRPITRRSGFQYMRRVSFNGGIHQERCVHILGDTLWRTTPGFTPCETGIRRPRPKRAFAYSVGGSPILRMIDLPALLTPSSGFCGTADCMVGRRWVFWMLLTGGAAQHETKSRAFLTQTRPLLRPKPRTAGRDFSDLREQCTKCPLCSVMNI